MAEGNKMKTFIMLVSFLGLFFFLVNSMPSGYLGEDEYIELTYPDIYDSAVISSYNFSDSHSTVWTFPTGDFGGNTTGLIEIGGHEIRISSADFYGIEMGLVEHKKGWWIFGWHSMLAPQGYSGLSYEYVSAFWSTETNMSSFSVTCDHLKLTVLITYNQTQFNSLQEAYEGHFIYCTVGIGFAESVTSSLGIWQLISSLLLFQAPEVHVLINLALVLPIYGAIAILIFMLIAELIPG